MDPSSASSDATNISNLPVGSSRLTPFTNRMSHWPWWALILALLGVFFAWLMLNDATYQTILATLSRGITITIRVTVISYALALIVGLTVALARLSHNFILYQMSTLYVEVVRGLPTLVLLLYVAFSGTRIFTGLLNSIGSQMIQVNILPQLGEMLTAIQNRDISEEARVIVALTIAYSAFLSEIFRAGIESIDRGQMEAARALGMTYWQAMGYVILRQAIRQVLPPLGNDFVAMLKDSSLVSVIGVQDITQRGNLFATTTFKYIETYNVMAYLYLAMTLLLSMGVKWIERLMARERRA